MDADAPVNERACTRRWQRTLIGAGAGAFHLNADAGHSPHTDNTHLADSSQLGRGGAPAPSSFQRVRRDKAASGFFCSARLKPLECERSFNAVPLRGERNSLKRDTLHTGVTFHREGPLKEQRSYSNKSPLKSCGIYKIKGGIRDQGVEFRIIAPFFFFTFRRPRKIYFADLIDPV